MFESFPCCALLEVIVPVPHRSLARSWLKLEAGGIRITLLKGVFWDTACQGPCRAHRKLVWERIQSWHRVKLWDCLVDTMTLENGAELGSFVGQSGVPIEPSIRIRPGEVKQME